MCSDIYLLWILSGVNGWLLLGLGVLLDRLIGLRITSIVLFSIFKSFDCPDIYVIHRVPFLPSSYCRICENPYPQFVF